MPSEWLIKGATLSDKSARKEFGLTRQEIEEAIRRGRLQYRMHSMHGNPWLRLLRREVEALVRKKHGKRGLKDRQAAAELARIDSQIRSLKRRLAALERGRSELTAGSGPRKRP